MVWYMIFGRKRRVETMGFLTSRLRCDAVRDEGRDIGGADIPATAAEGSIL